MHVVDHTRRRDGADMRSSAVMIGPEISTGDHYWAMVREGTRALRRCEWKRNVLGWHEWDCVALSGPDGSCVPVDLNYVSFFVAQVKVPLNRLEL